MKSLAVSLLCVCLVASYALTADVSWDGGALDGKWHSSANWSGDSLPQETDRVTLDTAGAQITIETGDEFMVTKILGPCYNVASTVTLKITGGTLNNPSYWYIGFKAGGIGVLDIQGGSVVTRDLMLASKDGTNGTINISDGLLEITGTNPGVGAYFGSDPVLSVNNGIATINLTGGTLKIAYLNSLGNNTVINIAGGQMLIAGDWRSKVSDYLQQGKIKGYDGGSDIGIDYNNINPGMTTLYGVTSISNAIASAPQAGAIIYVKAGVYNEGQFNIDKSLTLKSIDGCENTVLNLSGNGLSVIANDVTVDGFTIKNQDTEISYLLRVGKSIADVSYPIAGFTLKNCLIQASDLTDGVTVCSGSNEINIFDSKVTNCVNGIVVYSGCEEVFFNNNDVCFNSYGITVLGSAAQVKMYSNGIYDNVFYGVRNLSTVKLNAENNYWSYSQAGNVSGDVDFEPYLTECSDDRWHLCPQGDINGDCRTNIDDLIPITGNWLSCNGLDCD